MNKYVFLLLPFFLFPRTVTVAPIAEAKPIVAIAHKNPVVGQNLAVNAIWNEYPLLERVCSCESWGSPNKIPREDDISGNVLIGYPNPNDKGACQIHVPAWGATAIKLGYNIYTLQGNVDMAVYILKHQGYEAWSASESCWK
jgi:hypothetical protein